MISPLVTGFRLSPPSHGVTVDVELRVSGDRWIAAATVGRSREVGIGSTAGQALAASLGALPDPVRRALLADLALLEPSVEVARIAVGR